MPPLGAIVVGLLYLSDSRGAEASAREWVYWPVRPRYGRRALVPGVVLVTAGTAAFLFHLITILR
jgi:hypothetical protein